MEATPRLVGIENRNTRLACRLIGAKVKFRVHWPDQNKPSKGCYGPRCKLCPDVVSDWYALAAQSEERRVIEPEVRRVAVYPDGFASWPCAAQEEWLRANRPQRPEPIEEITIASFVLSIPADTFAAFATEDLHGLKLVMSRPGRGGSIRVQVQGNSVIGLCDDFDPTTALVRRYGPAIRDGIKAILAEDSQEEVIDERPDTLPFMRRQA